ncbi:MAG: threonine-phosphate decarboxylase CobD [Sulfuritalea sp.]|nr:threonine-phosphate decarboxylase CobD [Sulfuritalea sp.]
MLEHGGRLRDAALHWRLPLAGWLDLSTGIAPWPYPVNVSAVAWQRLPEEEDGLEAAAARYYGHPAPLPLPGSQAAILWLPRLFAPGIAVLPAPTYGEYAPAWRAAGHEVREIAIADIADAEADVIVLVNPNNPTGAGFAPEFLRALAERQAARDNWLVVDEAFADATPDIGIAALAGTELPRLAVLRSMGKFFGLAGARVGFLCAAPALRAKVHEALGPWAVAHPSREAAGQALADTFWQSAQRLRLAAASHRLGELLARHGLPSTDGGRLFRYAPTPAAAELHDFLARRGILVRLFRHPDALRLGLPAAEADWRRLEAVLAEWSSP